MGIIRIKHTKSGYAIVVLIVILLVATGIGLFGLRSSQGTLKKIGVRRSVTELKYESERGLQKAVQRIQAIAEGETDVIAVQNADASGTTGGDYGEKTLEWLVGTNVTTYIPEENASGVSSANIACNNWDPDEGFDKITENSNVVCNFLGVNEEDIHVALVRKDDLDAEGNTFGIFLINAIAYDTSGRRQIAQGVVVVPYSSESGNPSLSDTPYLSNSKTVLD